MSENIENMDFLKTEKISKERRMVGAHFDTGCDYLLPDYMGDLKKILSFKAITSPERGYVNGDIISVGGIVEVRVLYLDSENKLTEARIEKDYEYEIKCSKDVINAYGEPEVVNLSVRASGPRKLSLKMSICPVTYVIEESSLDMPIIPKDARVLEKSFKLHKPRRG